MSARYSRQLALNEIGEKGQEKLINCHITVVGCGGLGAIAATYLAGAGVGNITLIDGDQPDVSNLHRQVFFEGNELISKATVLKNKISILNPDVRCNDFSMHLKKSNIHEILHQTDLVIECTDDQASKYLVNDFCVLEEIPLVYGAIHKFEGYVSFFNNKKEADIHLRDIFPKPNYDIPSCEEIGVYNIIAGIMGLFQANEALKYLLQIGQNLNGKLLTYNALESNQYILNLKKNWIKDMEDYFQENQYESYTCDPIPQIDVKTLLKLRKSIDLISVMPIEQHIKIDENTIHILPSQFTMDRLTNNGRKKVVYCKTGRISRSLISKLRVQSKKINIYNLEGGLKAYQKFKALN